MYKSMLTKEKQVKLYKLTFMAKLVFNLVSELDVSCQVLVSDQDSTNWTGFFRHQGIFAVAA
jgi:hypothetical protein